MYSYKEVYAFVICWLTSSSMHLLLMYGCDWPWHFPSVRRLYEHLVCICLPFIVSLYDIGCLWYWPCIDVMHDSSPWPVHPSLLGPLGSCKKFMLLSPMFHNHRASFDPQSSWFTPSLVSWCRFSTIGVAFKMGYSST